jgi:glycosyltransferase involved in cell wall biosynthesis
MKVVVLTTSYPTPEHPVAGNFVASSVEAARSADIEVRVVSPADFPHFGIAYGGGVAQNLRAAPWRLALVPGFLGAFAWAARREAKHADLVHAHWIPSALAAQAARKPYVLQVWGTDVELARRAPFVTRPLVRGARAVIASSSYLAEEARALGARKVLVVPTQVPIPHHVGPPAHPPHVLFAGRLSHEKGIIDFVAATEGIPRVIVGDGPLRARVPEAIGFVRPTELSRYFESAAVVCVPSLREGYGMIAREALAHGRPVVASDVGGLADLGPGTRLVTPGDVTALRREIQMLLSDGDARAALGAEGRRHAVGLDEAAACLRAAYVSSLG